MVLIKIKNNSIHLERPLVNSGNFLLGLKALTFTGLHNLIRIETDCVITIGGIIVTVEPGRYTIDQLNKKINPVVISLSEENIVKITCNTYYHLDENFCKYLNLEYIKLDYSKISEIEIRYIPVIRLDRDCIIKTKEYKLQDKIEFVILNTEFVIKKGIYSLKQFQHELNKNTTYNRTIIKLDENNIIHFTSNISFIFEDYLKEILGVENYHYEFRHSDVEITHIGNKTSKFINNKMWILEGNIYMDNTEYNIKSGYYTIEELNKIIPTNMKISLLNNYTILIESDKYFELDENLNKCFGINKKNFSIRSYIGLSPIYENIIITPLEIHCNIIEKSFSSVNNIHHVEEELLFVFLFDSNKIFVRPEKIFYVPVSLKTIKTINISIFDQNGNEFILLKDPIFYLDLLDLNRKNS